MPRTAQGLVGIIHPASIGQGSNQGYQKTHTLVTTFTTLVTDRFSSGRPGGTGTPTSEPATPLESEHGAAAGADRSEPPK